MEWNDVKFILAIAEHGTLQAAASALKVNHTTVWRKVQALEKTLGSQLFIADRQGYRPTESGMEILEHARLMAANMDAIGRIASGQNKELKGLIRLTAPAGVVEDWLPRLIREFRDTHPDINFEILSKSAALNLDKREADIAFRAANDIPDNLIGRELGVSRWSMKISPELYRGDPLPLAALKDWPVIGYNNQFNNPAAQWLAASFKDCSQVASCSDVGAAAACARAGLGMALLPPIGTEDLTEMYRLPEIYDTKFWLLTHKDLRSSARIKAFWDFVLEKHTQENILGLL